ncbi:putative lipase atg15, partial [Massospora cicadina]
MPPRDKIYYVCWFIILFTQVNSQTHRRQVNFSYLYDHPVETVKLHLRQIYHFGSPHDSHTEDIFYQGGSIFKVTSVSEGEPEGFVTPHKELDYRLLQKHIDSGGLLAFKEPNDDVLKLRKTIFNLAKMAEHAYDTLPSSPWVDLDPGWHVNSSFGWNGKSVRGYVFSDEDNANLVISFKGTSLSFLPGGGGATVPSDRESDNLMFSCCQKLIYDAVVDRYKAANVCSSDIPFSFEAPGRGFMLGGLASMPLRTTAGPSFFHYGHNADPLFLGTCNGRMSLCYLAGYGMDSQCHTSTTCIFDAVGALSWSESLFHHRISDVVGHIYETWANGALRI